MGVYKWRYDCNTMWRDLLFKQGTLKLKFGIENVLFK